MAFDSGKHPRDANGRFASKLGGSSKPIFDSEFKRGLINAAITGATLGAVNALSSGAGPAGRFASEVLKGIKFKF